MPILLHTFEAFVYKDFAEKMQHFSEILQNYTETLSGSIPVRSNTNMHFSDDDVFPTNIDTQVKSVKCTLAQCWPNVAQPTPT